MAAAAGRQGDAQAQLRAGTAPVVGSVRAAAWQWHVLVVRGLCHGRHVQAGRLRPVQACVHTPQDALQNFHAQWAQHHSMPCSPQQRKGVNAGEFERCLGRGGVLGAWTAALRRGRAGACRSCGGSGQCWLSRMPKGHFCARPACQEHATARQGTAASQLGPVDCSKALKDVQVHAVQACHGPSMARRAWRSGFRRAGMRRGAFGSAPCPLGCCCCRFQAAPRRCCAASPCGRKIAAYRMRGAPGCPCSAFRMSAGCRSACTLCVSDFYRPA